MERLNFDELATRYCKRQKQSIIGLRVQLQQQKDVFNPDGWMLLECQMLDGSRFGQLTILPYGQQNTYQEISTHPISPRGLASDMSVVVAYLPVELF